MSHEIALTRKYRKTPLRYRDAVLRLEGQMAEHLQSQGARLRQARKALKLSQEDAAHLIAVSVKTFGSWERGESEPRDRNWRRIEEQLKVRVEEVRGEPPASQIDRIEQTQRHILTELSAIRTQVVSLETRLQAPRTRRQQPPESPAAEK